MQALNDKEGPHTNIFALKFEAREQMLEVRRILRDVMMSEPTVKTQIQLADIYLMLGNNLFETEEEKEALDQMLRAFKIVQLLREGLFYDFKAEPECALEELLGTSRLPVPDPTTGGNFLYVGLYLDVLNAVGIFLSHRDVKERIEDATRVLHHAEAFYKAWDPTDTTATPVDAFGKVPVRRSYDKHGVVDKYDEPTIV